MCHGPTCSASTTLPIGLSKSGFQVPHPLFCKGAGFDFLFEEQLCAEGYTPQPYFSACSNVRCIS